MKTFNPNKTMNRSKTIGLVALGLVLVSPVKVTLAGEWQANIGGMIGQAQLKNKDWGNQDSQGAIGLISDFGSPSAPFHVAVDLIGSGDEDQVSGRKNEVTSAAAHLGVRKVFDDSASAFKPYVGGGIALINTEMRSKDKATNLSRIEDDDATGFWIGIGSYVELNNDFQVGIDLRYSEADVTLFDTKRQAGGLQTAVSIGYHW